MMLNLYDLVVDFIGPVPDILEPIYWVGTFFMFVVITRFVIWIMSFVNLRKW